ncbi:MAG: GntR family transcriptional regulator [Candidatus Dormibacteria bacterium]
MIDDKVTTVAYTPRREPRVGVPSKTQQIAEFLRRDIAAGTFPAGVRLEQRDMATRYGTSPTPVREALALLAAEGLVVHTPNVGVTVADVKGGSVEEIREVYRMRAALEGLAAEMAHAHLSRTQIADLRRIHAAFCDAVQARDANAQRTLNHSFHMRIYMSAHADRLLRVIEPLWMLYPWETLWLDPDRLHSMHDHAAILEALASGTADEARVSMATHIENGYRILVAFLDRAGSGASGDPAEAPAACESG